MKGFVDRWLIAASSAVLIAALTSACTGAPEDTSSCRQLPAETGELPERSRIPAEALPFPALNHSELPVAKQQALQAALHEFIDSWGMMRSLNGATAAVASAEGMWAGATGVDGAGRPLVQQSAAPIASITKTVTAAEVIALVDKGLVDLDKFASTYIESPLLAREPTVRELLTHMSGVPDYFDLSEFAGPVAADPARKWTRTDLLAFASAPLSDPGSFHYANTNYLLLEMLIEKVTGVSYVEALRRDVLACGPNRLFVQPGEQPIPPLVSADSALGLVPDGRYVPNTSVASALRAAGGVAADARSVAEWGYQLYGGWVVSKNRTMEMAVQASPNWGLGTYITRTVGHGGHLPGHTSTLAVVPQKRLSVAILLVGDVLPESLDSLVAQLEAALEL